MNQDDQKPQESEIDDIHSAVGQRMKMFLEELDKPEVAGSWQIACDRTGTTHDTYWRWKREKPEFAVRFKQVIQNQRARAVDIAINKLIVNVNKGKQQAIQYFLNNVGETEEWGKWSNVTTVGGKDDGPIPVTVVSGDYLKRLEERKREVAGASARVNNKKNE